MRSKKYDKAFIVYPKKWTTQETFEYAIPGNFILFIENGPEENWIQTFLIDEEEFDEIEILDKLDHRTLVIFYSLSALNLKSKFMHILQIKELELGFAPTKIGVITASPKKKHFPDYKKWSSFVFLAALYEENSAYSSELSTIFKVIHFPLIQYSSVSNAVQDNGKRVHFSGTLKYNRADWLIVLRALCITLGVDFKCNIVREKRSGRSKNFTYISELQSSIDRMQYSLGINLAQRDPGTDAKLIGTFWDYYRNSCVPIVIGENTREIATYMERNVDYFSAQTEEDLRDILLFAFADTDHLLQMRKRICDRFHSEFSPKVVLESLLAKLDAE